jgi:hypothetical protein
MATSSIFASFDITDPKKARAFVRALEKSASSSPNSRPKRKTIVTDRKRIKALFSGYSK